MDTGKEEEEEEEGRRRRMKTTRNCRFARIFVRPRATLPYWILRRSDTAILRTNLYGRPLFLLRFGDVPYHFGTNWAGFLDGFSGIGSDVQEEEEEVLGPNVWPCLFWQKGLPLSLAFNTLPLCSESR